MYTRKKVYAVVLTEPIQKQKGSKQGCAISSRTFAMVLHNILKKAIQNRIFKMTISDVFRPPIILTET